MQLTQLIGNFEATKNASPLRPFAAEIIDFFGALSGELLKASKLPDIATFAFWCRKSRLLQEKASYDDLANRLGRGVVFHSTPSNVAINFAYSFAAGLLAGNANIVRLPAKDFEQVDIVCKCINELLNGKFSQLKPYVSMLKYTSSKAINDKLSKLADARIIWGGDETIARMRTSLLPPRAIELTFADRYSVAVISADAYLLAEDKSRIARDFYNDTYLSDSNACTAPSMIFWLGEDEENISKAKTEFWGNIQCLVKSTYELSPVQAVGKLAALYRCAVAEDIALSDDRTNFIHRLDATNTSEDILRYKYHSGFFFEREITSLDEVLSLADKKCQTLTYFGIKRQNLETLLAHSMPKGIDRMVPMGHAMDFSLVWDGFDLIRELSRKVVIL